MREVSAEFAYCGLPPLPSELASRWNPDPVLITVLLGVAALYAWSAMRMSAARRERVAFAAGWLTLTLALISPLCALSVALFSARVGQHMLLVLIAAPLLALAQPVRTIATALSPARGASLSELLISPVVATLSFALFLWLWHLPRPYQATFISTPSYWLMHVTLTGTAVLLWEVLFEKERGHFSGRLLAGFATLMHMGLLGALITLAPRVLYPVHLLTSLPWGLTALEDQQLGGLIMWIPGCAALAMLLLARVYDLLREPPAKASASARVSQQ